LSFSTNFGGKDMKIACGIREKLATVTGNSIT
uniref:Aldehyde dehydrogenase n=1 Tax=Brugia timori TaxID=42155 RepID=A0A0R3Q8V1_9BILA